MALNLQKLSAAKLWLVSSPVGAPNAAAPRDLAYLSQPLYSLIAVENDQVSTMTCDQWWRIYINAVWLEQASVPEIGAELAHVTWHLLQDHAARAHDCDVDLSTVPAWTTATDVAVTHTLTPDRVCPDRLPTAAQEGLRSGRSAEEYFATLSRLAASGGSADGRKGGGELAAPFEGCGSGADGIHRNYDRSPDADLGAIDAFEAHELRRIVAIEFRGHLQHRGTDPGNDLRWIAQVLQPEIPWEPLLTSAARQAVGWAAGRGDYTYRRPSRRSSSASGVILPGQHRSVPRVSIIIDTSASVDDKLLARALGEVDGVIGSLGIPGANITIYSVDAAVHTTQNLRHANDAQLVGAGGTDLRIGLAAVERQRPRPDIVIVFTDGDTPWPTSPPPGTTILIALLGRRGQALPSTPRWAVRVECRLSH